MQNTENLKISSETIARTICLALALINQLLAIFGKGQIPFVEDTVYQVVSIVFTIVTSIWSWWKNNSFTQAALRADVAMKFLKEEQ